MSEFPSGNRKPVPGTLGRRLLVVAVAAGIFYVSHQPSLPSIPLFPHQDKLFHFGEFFLFGLVLFWNRDMFPEKGRLPGVILTGFAYSILDEVHQSFVPGRDCSVGDFLADSAGVLLAVLLARKILLRRLARCRDHEA